MRIKATSTADAGTMSDYHIVNINGVFDLKKGRLKND